MLVSVSPSAVPPKPWSGDQADGDAFRGVAVVRGVGAAAAVDRVGAAAALDHVVAAETEDRVVAAEAEDRVGAVGDAVERIDRFRSVGTDRRLPCDHSLCVRPKICRRFAPARDRPPSTASPLNGLGPLPVGRRLGFRGSRSLRERCSRLRGDQTGTKKARALARAHVSDCARSLHPAWMLLVVQDPAGGTSA